MKKIIIALTLFVTFTVAAVGQIPNGDFQNWDTVKGYNMPVSWDNFNSLTASKNVFTCERGEIKGTTNSYIRLVSDSVEGMGVVPGIAVCGTLDKVTHLPKSGFAYSQRPGKLKGQWQFMAPGDDHGFVAVYLTKWNQQTKKRDIIGSGVDTLSGMAMSWIPFEVVISYSNSSNPDSCIIVLSASGSAPLQYSYLYVNDLSFDISSGIVDGVKLTSLLKIYPNPASEKIQIDLSEIGNVREIQIQNELGKLVLKEAIDQYTDELCIDHLLKGIYFVKVQTIDGIITGRFVKL